MTTPQPNLKPEDIKASYGYIARLAEVIPDLRPILEQAVRESWTQARFEAAIANTQWWANTPDFSKQRTIQLIMNPAQAEKELARGKAEMINRAVQLGFKLPDDAMAERLWIHSQVHGLKDNEINSWLAVQLFDQTKPGEYLGGRYGEIVNEAYKLAFDYGYNSPNLQEEILGFARYLLVAGGNVSTEGWKTKMQDYAMRKYAPFAEDIRGGKTVAELARPIMESVGQLLELTPDQLSLRDPIVNKALTEWNNSTQKAYTLTEVQKMAREDERWQTTMNGRDYAIKLINQLGKMFGRLDNG